MRRRDSLPPVYFEDMFAADPDPWRFETSAYEAEKYRATVAALGGRKYRAALEVGCAIGVLTEKLSAHVLDLLAIDVSETALARAATRCSGARFDRRAFPAEAPDGLFDLIVLSEVLYYLDDQDLSAAGRWADGALARGGDLLLVHWTGETDYPQSGDDAVAKFDAAMRVPIERLRAERHERYRLDMWRRVS
ncbi:class I SAM-dependent DNA methyltransferase [Hansschlegelia zhihuaiae]|uniref:Methyltransferase domain-containing protein n=1 Tax=Hansschlegelia zhihuaiae TaxID=405005 RepID=A0A4Q0M4Q3_9HYPH|nr:SAM-dependent methyltransferase [Hansschlegelia zhihuaiae]RXF67937.1 methyltransferase domain-containing protein [Hansschlegelia zhihuaiae]